MIYRESLNGALINELEIEFDSLEYLILKNSNQAVLSFDKLEDLIKNSEYHDILDSELFNMLEELKKEGLIYTPCDYSEIVSIIDIDNAI